MRAANDWIAFLNHEAKQLKTFASDTDKTGVREALVEALCSKYRFPLKTHFRGYVVRERLLKRVTVAASVAGANASDQPTNRTFLEVVPEGFGEEAYEILGGILVPLKRPLQAGSVLELTLELQSPSRFRLNPPGILSKLSACDVVVGVEA